jgi:hypothetical protein
MGIVLTNFLRIVDNAIFEGGIDGREGRMMAESDEERLKRITNMKAPWDRLAKKGLASGNDHWVTEASRRKADIDEAEAESQKEQAVTDRIFASGDKEAMLARLQELKKIWAGRTFGIHTWARVFPSKKQRSS